MILSQHFLKLRICSNRLYTILHWRCWSIAIVFLLLCTITIAQESTSEEFIFGSTFHREHRFNQDFYDKFRSSGMNFLEQYADPNGKDLLKGINFGAWNGIRLDEWIQYYSTAYYSKWEADENQTDTLIVGFK